MKMQKFTSMLLACLILVCNGGFAFNVHYCGEKIASVSIGAAPTEDCEKPAEPKACCAKAAKDHKACCSDKVVDMQDQPEVVVKSFFFDLEAPYVEPVQAVSLFAAHDHPVVEKRRTYRYTPHAPPLFKLYKQLIFYA